jgi:hypothetical protein
VVGQRVLCVNGIVGLPDCCGVVGLSTCDPDLKATSQRTCAASSRQRRLWTRRSCAALSLRIYQARFEIYRASWSEVGFVVVVDHEDVEGVV